VPRAEGASRVNVFNAWAEPAGCQSSTNRDLYPMSEGSYGDVAGRVLAGVGMKYQLAAEHRGRGLSPNSVANKALAPGWPSRPGESGRINRRH